MLFGDRPPTIRQRDWRHAPDPIFGSEFHIFSKKPFGPDFASSEVHGCVLILLALAGEMELSSMILAYHEIVPKRSSYIYSVDCCLLAEHLAFMSSGALNAHTSPAPAVTFDDGHASQYRHALSILDRAQVRATFFITVGWPGARPEYMTWEELKDLLSAGHAVQAHGWSHKLLTSCSSTELTEELLRSRETLEEKLGTRVDSISMPGGRWSDRVSRACAETGYRFVYVSNPWMKPRVHFGAVHMGRLMVRNSTSLAQLERYARRQADPFHLSRAAYGIKRAANLALGDRMYASLWKLVGRKAAVEQLHTEYIRDRQQESGSTGTDQ